MVGGENSNIMVPIFLGANHYEYDVNALPQLQLFGDCTIPAEGTSTPINYTANEHVKAINYARKRVREEDSSILKQQKLPISLNNNSFHDKGSVLNPKRVSTGLGLSCEEEERNAISSSSMVKAEIDLQRVELDHYMRVQEANIFKGIQELSHRHTNSIVTALRKRVVQKLHEKDVEIEKINSKNNELGERIKQASIEAQSWHYKAKYSESVINMLKSNLQQVMAQGAAQNREGCGESEVDDVASFTKLPDNKIVSENFAVKQLIKCKACEVKEVEILLLPCRHLCLCKNCEGFVDLCPVCRVMKAASVEVHLS